MRLFNKGVISAVLALILVMSTVMPTFAMVERVADKDESSFKELLNHSLAEKHDVKINQVEDQKLRPSEDTLIIKYKKPLSLEQHQRAGAVLSKRIIALGYDVVKIQRNQKLEEVMNSYKKFANVVSVTPSYPFQKLATNDPKSASMYHLSQLRINEALKLAGKNKVVVAVVDTGLDKNHPELKKQILPDYNAVMPLRRGLADMHGTHVAGIIAAQANNGIGGMGVNPNVKILPIDVFSRQWGASDYAIADGIMHAIERKADVINMSLGGYYPSPIIEDAVRKAINAGIVVVAAAGNSGDTMKSYPAAFSGVISVGATNEKKELAEFSTYGPNIDIVAPGENVYAPVYDFDKKSSFMKASGTSMASPVVAAVASLLLSKHPDLTPYQVKYILEQTAKDLGDSGYDVKYGFGLVDPVAALKYDVKKVPKQPIYKQADIIKKAKNVSFSKDNKVTITDKITTPKQQNWLSLNLNKGEVVQLVLDVPQKYDYTLLLQFSAAEKNETIEVNEATESKLEAYLYEAKDKGTLLIGVKDTNEKYSESGKSNYKLAITKYDSLKEDENNVDNMVKIDKFPYETKDQFYLTGEEGDSDYYSFSVANADPNADVDAVAEQQLVEVRLGAIPGINSTLNVYMAEEFKMYASELESMPKNEDPSISYGPYPLFQSNKNGTSEGEILILEAMPGMEYILEVTSKSDFNNWDPFFDFYFTDVPKKISSANIPYELSLKAETLPTDEDGYPSFGMEMESMAVEGTIVEFHQKRQQQEESFYDFYMGGYYFGEEYVAEILNAAQPFELGSAVEGHFQYSGDVDVYLVNPTESGIYEFTNNKTGTLNPFIEIMKYTEDEEGKGQFTTIVYSNSFDWFYRPVEDNRSKNSVYAGLEKGEKYVIMLNNNYSPSFDRYSLSSKLLLADPQDAYYGNNSFEAAKPLPKYTMTGNFALSEMMDVFYFKAAKDDVYGLLVENGEVPKRLKETLPKELFKTFWPIISIIQDTNGNKKLDKEEESAAMNYFGWETPEIRASFKARKGKGYFVVISKMDGMTTLTPYQMTLTQVDEKTNVKIPFTQIAAGKWQTKGFLPFSNMKKQENRYRFTAPAKGTYQIQFEMPNDIDGVLAIYNNTGKLIKKVDHYGTGDSELVTVTLDKGNYAIGVQDYYGNTSVSQYTLTVKKQ